MTSWCNRDDELNGEHFEIEKRLDKRLIKTNKYSAAILWLL